MDFSRVELSDDDQAFLDEARDFLRTHVTDEVIRRDRETGDNFDEGVHLALGEAGYLAQGVEAGVRRRLQSPPGSHLGSSRSDAPTFRGSRRAPPR